MKKPDDILKITVYISLFLFFLFGIGLLLIPTTVHPRSISLRFDTRNNLKLLAHIIMDHYYSEYGKRPKGLCSLYEFANDKKYFEAHFGETEINNNKYRKYFLSQKDSFGIPFLFTETKVGTNEVLMFSSAGINKKFGDEDDINKYWPSDHESKTNYKLPLIHEKVVEKTISDK